MSVKSGNGAAFTFGTSGFTPLAVSIDGLEETLEALQDSDLSTTNYHTMCPADLIEISPFTAEIRWEQGDIPPLGTVELITLTYQLETGESVAATLTGTGFLTSRVGPNLANNEISSGSITIQLDGKSTEPTYTPGS
jgi:hypothetical protein